MKVDNLPMSPLSNDGENVDVLEPAAISDRLYTPEPGELQLTVRALLAGSVVGGIVACTNLYIGLKIGWTFGGAIIAAVLSYSLFSLFRVKLSVLETNTVQTAGSAAGYMSSAAGLIAPIPALMLLGIEYPWYQLLLWTISAAFLGVFFAIPLRRQMIVQEKLRFPSGRATAETIMAMNSDADEANAKAKVLLITGILAGLFSLSSHFFPYVEEPPFHDWFPDVKWLTVPAMWGFVVYLGPSLMGAGFLVGPRVVLSMLAGAIISWGILAPLSLKYGWAPNSENVMSYTNGARGWILWPGVALMVSEALGSLVFQWRTFVDAFKMPVHTEGDMPLDRDVSELIPTSWALIGLTIGTCTTTIITSTFFGIPWYLVLVAITLSGVLSIVACRSVGETDINPIGGLGKVTQFVFGAIAPASLSTNLMTAAITSAGASQAGDMMTDLKTGHLLGASPRKQLVAQLCGIVVGIVFALPVYYLFTYAYEIGDPKGMPAPAAMAWKAVAEVLKNGLDSLPKNAVTAAVIASIIGFTLAGLSRISSIKKFVPSGLAMGISFIVAAKSSLVIFYGMMIWLVWNAIAPKQVEKYNFALSSGLIAGEGMMGIVKAVLSMMKIDDKLFLPPPPPPV